MIYVHYGCGSMQLTEQAKTSTSNPDICEAMTASRESGSCFIDNLFLSIVCIHSYY